MKKEGFPVFTGTSLDDLVLKVYAERMEKEERPLDSFIKELTGNYPLAGFQLYALLETLDEKVKGEGEEPLNLEEQKRALLDFIEFTEETFSFSFPHEGSLEEKRQWWEIFIARGLPAVA
jgi:hypothetical protein